MSTDDLRNQYIQAGLSETELESNPLAQFDKWFQDAIAAELFEPSATCLATASRLGKPSARMVLLRGVNERGFLFFSNYQSNKARELAENPQAALVIAWIELARQVCISGSVVRISREESARYFQSRPTGSQLSAWTSPQSQVIPNRQLLEDRWNQFQTQYQNDKVPLPPFWGGYCLSPASIEFWQGRPDRLHDRLRYRLLAKENWTIERLAP